MAATYKSTATAILGAMQGITVFSEKAPRFPEDTEAVTFLGKQGRIRIRQDGTVVRPDYKTNGRLTGGAENLLHRLRSDKQLALALRTEVLGRIGTGGCVVLGVPVTNEDAIEGATEF